MTEVELEYKPLDLDNLRSALIRQEESILFAIIERAQFKQNSVIYTPGGAFNFGNSFTGSFFQFCLFETECTHAKLRRYTSPDEHAFFPVDQLPSPALPVYKYPTSIVENNININQEILDIYL
jgi:chorismate mutase